MGTAMKPQYLAYRKRCTEQGLTPKPYVEWWDFEDWVRLYLPELNDNQIKMLMSKINEI